MNIGEFGLWEIANYFYNKSGYNIEPSDFEILGNHNTLDNHNTRIRMSEIAVSNGRTYSIQILTADSFGNQASKKVSVSLPESVWNDGKDLSVTALPNPSGNSYFTIRINSGYTNQPVSLQLLNDKGMLMQAMANVLPGQTINIGNFLMGSFYLLKAIQSNMVSTIKLLKW